MTGVASMAVAIKPAANSFTLIIELLLWMQPKTFWPINGEVGRILRF
jgi:hypothetical protein